jgi:hypothetical protein
MRQVEVFCAVGSPEAAARNGRLAVGKRAEFKAFRPALEDMLVYRDGHAFMIRWPILGADSGSAKRPRRR